MTTLGEFCNAPTGHSRRGGGYDPHSRPDHDAPERPDRRAGRRHGRARNASARGRGFVPRPRAIAGSPWVVTDTAARAAHPHRARAGLRGADTAALRRDWQRALDTGAKRLGGFTPLRDGDVALVWYADALDPLSPTRCSPEELKRIGMGADDGGLGALVGVAGGVLAALASDAPGEDRRELLNLAGDLQFLGDPEKQCAAERQVGRALAAAVRARRPVIVVGHSLGSVVAWSHLRRAGAGAVAGAPVVERFVTLGSPLGSPMVRAMLLGGDAGRITAPKQVRSWVNVVAEEDPLAIPIDAADVGIVDVTLHSGAGEDPHDIASYLRHPVGAAAVLEAWCDAMPGGCTREP